MMNISNHLYFYDFYKSLHKKYVFNSKYKSRFIK